jgi:hypothetical protein
MHMDMGSNSNYRRDLVTYTVLNVAAFKGGKDVSMIELLTQLQPGARSYVECHFDEWC